MARDVEQTPSRLIGDRTRVDTHSVIVRETVRKYLACRTTRLDCDYSCTLAGHRENRARPVTYVRAYVEDEPVREQAQGGEQM
jgi:hypothetical protein